MDGYNLFISWSGELSSALAKSLAEWIPSVIQAARPYYSPDDIEKGTRWFGEISKELSDVQIGLICLTRDNLTAPWIMFEAGSVSKNLDKAHVCPILFGIDPADVTGPLAQFQLSRFQKEDVQKLMRTINGKMGAQALNEAKLEMAFEKWWPDLDGNVQRILSTTDTSGIRTVRPDREILEEILAVTRSFVDREKISERSIPSAFFITLAKTFRYLILSVKEDSFKNAKAHFQKHADSISSILSLVQDPHKPDLVKYWSVVLKDLDDRFRERDEENTADDLPF
jgi:hypothetical protein